MKFELIGENSSIKRTVFSKLELKNKTYEVLKEHFRKEMIDEKNKNQVSKPNNVSVDYDKIAVNIVYGIFWFLVIIVAGIMLYSGFN